MSVHSEHARGVALYMQRDQLSKTKLVIVDLLAARGGMTREEIAAELGKPQPTICGRVNELERDGILVSTAERRDTQYGRPATVVCIREQPRPTQLNLALGE
jgi:predicted ArsR family transcriptional regulator